MLHSLAHRIRQIQSQLKVALNNLTQKIPGSIIADEDDFTSRLLHMMETQIDIHSHDLHITTQYIKLKSRGKASEESRVGADLLAVAHVVTPTFKTTKGIIAQAKLLPYGAAMSNNDWSRLVGQCDSMLSTTPDSYVWLYGARDVRVHRAYSMGGLSTRRPDDLEWTSLTSFHYHFLMSRHRDSRLYFSDIPRLESAMQEYQINHGLLTRVTAELPDTEPLTGYGRAL